VQGEKSTLAKKVVGRARREIKKEQGAQGEKLREVRQTTQ
jgi:hypothetical protein